MKPPGLVYTDLLRSPVNNEEKMGVKCLRNDAMCQTPSSGEKNEINEGLCGHQS